MARYSKQVSEHVLVITGFDHAIGVFIQVYDDRYHGEDEYVFEWDQLFGTSVNLIGVTEHTALEDILDLCNAKFGGISPESQAALDFLSADNGSVSTFLT